MNRRTLTSALIAVVIAAFLVAPMILPKFLVFNLTMMMVYSIALLGVNLLTGYGGQMSIATSVFIAIGAYASAILTMDYGMNYLITIPIAGAVSFLAGYLLGLPALRLKGFYLATITLSLAVALPPLLKRFEGLTHGAGGLIVRRPAAPDWTGLSAGEWRYYLVLAITVLAFIAASGIAKGIFGRSLIALRDNEIVAEGLGVDLARHKTISFAFSAALAGICGSLYVLNVGIAAPDSFSLFLSIFLLAASVVGGIATIAGAMYGAAFYVFVPVYAGEINEGLVGILFGVAIILTMLVMRKGAAGFVDFCLDWIANRIGSGKQVDETRSVTIAESREGNVG